MGQAQSEFRFSPIWSWAGINTIFLHTLELSWIGPAHSDVFPLMGPTHPDVFPKFALSLFHPNSFITNRLEHRDSYSDWPGSILFSFQRSD